MRSLYSGRKLVGRQVLLVVVLSAPAFLHAQSASSPQAQPAEAAPADSVPAASPNPGEPLIERARQAASQFSRKLPNFVCEELMSRFVQRGRDQEMQQYVLGLAAGRRTYCYDANRIMQPVVIFLAQMGLVQNVVTNFVAGHA